MSGQWNGSRRRDHRSGSGWDEQQTAKRILRRDAHRCYLRGPSCVLTATEVDHVIPFSQGGTDVDTNKRAVCVPCHRAKTQAEAATARAGTSRRRPAEPHPGLRTAS